MAQSGVLSSGISGSPWPLPKPPLGEVHASPFSRTKVLLETNGFFAGGKADAHVCFLVQILPLGGLLPRMFWLRGRVWSWVPEVSPGQPRGDCRLASTRRSNLPGQGPRRPGPLAVRPQTSQASRKVSKWKPPTFADSSQLRALLSSRLNPQEMGWPSVKGTGLGA